MSETPKQGGWWRCCVYASEKRVRGVHQFALLVTPDMVHAAYAPAEPPYVLLAGQADPVDVSMVSVWHEHVDPLRRDAPRENGDT